MRLGAVECDAMQSCDHSWHQIPCIPTFQPPPPQIERVKAEHEAKEAEQDAQQRKEFEAALALKRRFAPMLPFRHAFEEAVNKVRCGGCSGVCGYDGFGGWRLSQEVHAHPSPHSYLSMQVRRADFEAHVSRMRQEYERAMKQKIQRCVGVVWWCAVPFARRHETVHLSVYKCMHTVTFWTLASSRPCRARKRKSDKEEREAKRNREMEQIRQFVSGG